MATLTNSSSTAASSSMPEDVSVTFRMIPHNPQQAVFTVAVPIEAYIPPTFVQELQAIAQRIAANY
jgi:hypothetical protein